MVLRVLLYGLIIYLFYRYIIQPLFSGIGRGNEKSKVHYQEKQQDEKENFGEYIDYEEVDEKDSK